MRLTGLPTVLAWGIAVLIGMFGMVRYQMTPAASARETPVHWPADVHVSRTSGRPTLIMALHPQCPCSRASMHELAQIMSRVSAHMDAYVLFVQPEAAPANWLDSDLWREANAIPNVTVSIDQQGHDAMAFGASTSGHVMVYDAAGDLQFSGGITDGRGHEGDNAGLLAVLAIGREGKSSISRTPVYGCSLGVCRASSN